MMARARTIGPSHYLDEELAKLPDEVALAHARLPCIADRDGRLEDRPTRIGVEIFPYRPKIKMDRVLQQLNDAGKLVRYEVDGKCYLQLEWDGQHPHKNEKPSVIPPVPRTVQSTVPTTVQSTVPSTETAPCSLRQSLVSGSRLMVSGSPDSGAAHPAAPTRTNELPPTDHCEGPVETRKINDKTPAHRITALAKGLAHAKAPKV